VLISPKRLGMSRPSDAVALELSEANELHWRAPTKGPKIRPPTTEPKGKSTDEHKREAAGSRLDAALTGQLILRWLPD